MVRTLAISLVLLFGSLAFGCASTQKKKKEDVVCKWVTETGSRVQKKVCTTYDQKEDRTAEDQLELERIQRNSQINTMND